MSAFERAVAVVVDECLGLRPGERLVVVTDEGLREIGEALHAHALRSGGASVLVSMAALTDDGEEPLPAVAAALAHCDAYLGVTTASLSHTEARRGATRNGARGATLPGVTAEMLARMMGQPLGATRARSAALAEALTRAGSARVTCPRGTDLRLQLAGRPGHMEDGDLTAAGTFANLPFGEAYVAPVTGEGTLVTASISAYGRAEPPARLRVEDGVLVEASEAAGAWLAAQLDAHGPVARTLAELGVGTNEHAGLTGNVLEDEKALGSAHIAFGASVGFGGTVDVPIHLDCVIPDASVWLDDAPLLLDGAWQLS